MTIEYLSFSELLRLYRRRSMMSQKQLAKKINLDPSVISRWERDLRMPSMANVHDIAVNLNLSVSEKQNLCDAHTGLSAEALVFHELLSLYLDRSELSDTEIASSLYTVSRYRLRQWRLGADVPTNEEIADMAQCLKFDQAISNKLLIAIPRFRLDDAVIKFILLGTERSIQNS